MGPLTIVSSQDVGALGPRESPPASLEWRWYDYFPQLALWGVLAVLLVVPSANRHWQAWLILLPLFAVALVCRLLARLVSLPPEMADGFAGLFNT